MSLGPIKKYKLVSENGERERAAPVTLDLFAVNKTPGEYDGETLIEITNNVPKAIYKWSSHKNQWQRLS